MTATHPIISITGSSGAGTTSVKRIFELIFRREKVNAAYIEGDASIWEQAPLANLAADGQLMAYEHRGFWQPMDTLRDKVMLEDLWQSGRAPWKARWA